MTSRRYAVTPRQRYPRVMRQKGGGGFRFAYAVMVVLGAGMLLAFLVTAGLALTGWVAYERTARKLGDIETLVNQSFGGAKIYDRHGTLLYEFEDQESGQRRPLSLNEISPWLIDATVSTEDASFFENPGVNVRGLVRAGLENVLPFGRGLFEGSGGSSITQQLVKNVVIPEDQRYERSLNRRTADRKFKETVLALELTRRYSKEQILTWYLNQINYGNRANGIGAAAQRYFGVDAADLSLAQASLLAGIPQAPVAYDPVVNFSAAKVRQGQVLELMVRNNKLVPDQVEELKNEPLTFVTKDAYSTIRAPHWVFYIQEELRRRYGDAAIYREGLQVYTSLDLPLQERSQQIVDQGVAEFERLGCGCHNGSLVIMDNNTGEILAMVGSRDFFRKDIQGENNNTTSIKQPGSALKPAAYLAAFLKKGWSPASVVLDIPKRYANPGSNEPFIPEGPARQYLGPISVRQALASSMNAPAVQAAAEAGVPVVIDTAHKLGITTLTDPENYGVAVATGGANITLLDMTYMYSTLANAGQMAGVDRANTDTRPLDPVTILRIDDGRGRSRFELREPRREQVVPAAQAYMITSILSDDAARAPTYSPGLFALRDGRPVAAKTGTQQGFTVRQVRSTWNFGYTPDITVGVWVGNTDGALVSENLTSASSSLKIWREAMQGAVDYLNLPPKPFKEPPGLAKVRVTVPVPGGCRTTDDYVLANQRNAPIAGAGGGCRTVYIDTRNGLLAGSDTPPQFVQAYSYVDLPTGTDWNPGGVAQGSAPAAVSTLGAGVATAPPVAQPVQPAVPTLPSRFITATPRAPNAAGAGPPVGQPAPAQPGAPAAPTPFVGVAPLQPRVITPAPTQPNPVPPADGDEPMEEEEEP